MRLDRVIRIGDLENQLKKEQIERIRKETLLSLNSVKESTKHRYYVMHLVEAYESALKLGIEQKRYDEITYCDGVSEE